MFSIDGLISGLNTETIINGLVSLQKAQVDRLSARKSIIQSQQQAFQGIEARLLAMRTKLNQLNRTNNSLFNARKVHSSHENIVTATATENSAIGNYSLRVTGRANAHQIGSNTFTSPSQEITTGTISLQVGNRPPQEITIDSTNNTVDGLVQAINSQVADVSAAIINDQGTGTSRILLTSKFTGAVNEISIVNNLNSEDGIARPDFSGPAVQQASNAIVQLGSGPGAIVVEYETNRVTTLIEGVTLNLLSVDLDQDVQLTISRDTDRAEQAIREFADEFNSLMSFIQAQTKFDSETGVASPLIGNRNVTDLRNRLLAIVTETVPGLNGSINRLSQIGLNIDSSGNLNVDNGRLSNALNGNIQGLAANDVGRLFGMTGTSTNIGIEFILGSAKTKSSSVPYQINISQAAEQASITAGTQINSPVVIDSTNNTFQISIDGIESETLTLTEGTYTASQLATHLQAVINASPKLGNREVIVSTEGDALRITSKSYGSSSKVSHLNGTSLSALGFSGNESAIGKDVAGSFIVNGNIEAATGNGRVLIGNSGNEHTADLQVRVTLAANQVGAGIEGEIVVTRGATSRLDQFFGDFLDSQKGSANTVNNRFADQISSIDRSITRVNQLSDAKRAQLVRQFASLERALNALQTTSSIVASQLFGLQNGR
ncbi:MAG TPA: flagellar filament capping protein FliD [Pirellulaceae bacterium]|nr:flagellar filament capping protein FliD [Pirellulaceae bacterium]HMO91954.1 flagellar filament capping protein FliD [Pirellulaceae bacterium]HMP68753.1 flagellar filament capping protein FliD [Pirellulaceae bacterium]